MKHTELRAMASARAAFRAMTSANTLLGALAVVLLECVGSSSPEVQVFAPRVRQPDRVPGPN